MPINPTVDRLMRYLSETGRRYPKAWKWYDNFRADKGSKQLGNWPDWCYCPLAGAYAIVSGGGDNRVPFSKIQDCGILAAIAAWRIGKGIYIIHRELLKPIWETPVGKIPHEVLFCLPEWGIYVETPGFPIAGFFAHLEYDTNHGHAELRFVIEGHDGALTPIPLHLNCESLDECVAESVEFAREEWRKNKATDADVDRAGEIPAGTERGMQAMLSPLVSLVLYICSVSVGERDIREAKGRDRYPTVPNSGERLFVAGMPTFWEAGWRMGAALGAARLQTESASMGGAHSGPAPHVRRAHWHHFWRGPREGDRELVLKWLHPILVGMEDGETEPTVHQVK